MDLTPSFLEDGFYHNELGNAVLLGMSNVPGLPLTVISNIPVLPVFTIHTSTGQFSTSTFPIILAFDQQGPGNFNAVF